MAARPAGSSSTRPDLEGRLRTLPKSPGVYLFRDVRGRVLYVGKAVDLRSRVRSYFRQGGDGRPSVPLIVRQVADIETVVTTSETEALILEDTLIKEHRPRYNVRLRDDKSYVFLRLRMDHPYPWLERVRRPKADGSPLFGPFPNGLAARETSRVLHAVFPLRTCSNNKFAHRQRPCLDHQIGKCPAPCTGLISQEAYRTLAEGAKRFLGGERRDLIRRLQEEMERAADDMRFEDAAVLRDRIHSLEHTQERQDMVRVGRESADFWGLAERGERATLVVLRTVDGNLIDTESFPGLRTGSDDDALAQLVMQFYDAAHEIPASVYLPRLPSAVTALSDALAARRGKAVRVVTASRGEPRRLLALALRNAEARLQCGEPPDADRQAEALERLLHLPRAPHLVECYDVSVHQGSEPVGVGVVFERGEDVPERRRRYRLTPGEGQGDVQWLQEMLARRLQRGIREGDLPDLIVLDGGRAQLDAVLAVYRDLEVETVQVPLVALAKARSVWEGDETRSDSAERVFLPGRKNPVVLKPGSPAFRLLVALRDATHRAAVGYHRVRGRSALIAGLSQVPGLGPVRRRALVEAYGDLQVVPDLPPDEVARAAGIPAGVARTLQAVLRKLRQEPGSDTLEEENTPP